MSADGAECAKAQSVTAVRIVSSALFGSFIFIKPWGFVCRSLDFIFRLMALLFLPRADGSDFTAPATRLDNRSPGFSFRFGLIVSGFISG
jgi:hypothetical protein